MEHYDEFKQIRRKKAIDQLAKEYSLSDREKDVLFYVSYYGYDNVELGKHLYVSEFTIRRHLANIYKKMGVPLRKIQSIIINKLAECRREVIRE